MTPSSPESYVVRDKRLAVTRPISNPLWPYRCLYRSLRYLGPRRPVSREGKTMHADSRWLSGANQVSVRLRLECSCSESQP